MSSAVIDSPPSEIRSSSSKDTSSVLRLSLTALALIAGGLFLMTQDRAANPQSAAGHTPP